MSNEEPKLEDSFSFWEDVGFIVRYAAGVSKIIIDEKFCALCHASEYKHTEACFDSHPFFKDNLEYLEWEYEKKM